MVPAKQELTESVTASFEKDREGIVATNTAASLMRGVPPQLMELIAGMGEVWSAKTLCTYMSSLEFEAGCVDARDVLIVPDSSSGLGIRSCLLV